MGIRVVDYPIPHEEMEDYLWIATRLSEFDQAAFGPIECVQHLFLAWDGEVRVGGCTVSSRFGWMYVERLWVEREVRGAGIGQLLIYEVEKLAIAHSLMGIRLTTTSRHLGLPLYERMGFKEDYRLPGRLEDGSLIDEISLTKQFPR